MRKIDRKKSDNKKNSRQINLHGMNTEDARKRLCETLDGLPANVKTLSVIHGFAGGTALKDMARSFWHVRIDEIVPTFANDGETVFYLK